MFTYELYAVGDGDPACLDTFGAGDIREALALAFVRLEHCDTELRKDGIAIARLGRDGSVTMLPPERLGRSPSVASAVASSRDRIAASNALVEDSSGKIDPTNRL